MKKYIYSFVTLSIVFLNIACVNLIPEEQFVKSVNLVKNGWVEQNVEVTETNTSVFPVVVAVSGTSKNNENVNVEIGFDQTILEAYNYEKFKEQTELYYEMFPLEAVTLESTTVQVNSGNNTGFTNLSIDFGKVADKYKDYVIPLRIKNTTKYEIGEDDFITVLYHIRLQNDFSGDYTGSITVAKTRGTLLVTDENNKLTVAGKTFYALSGNESYIYAGQIDRQHPMRSSFIINVRVDENDSIIMSSPVPELKFVQESADMTVTRRDNLNDLRYEIVTTVFDFRYIFFDLTQTTEPTTSENHILRAWGSISMTKNVLKK